MLFTIIMTELLIVEPYSCVCVAVYPLSLTTLTNPHFPYYSYSYQSPLSPVQWLFEHGCRCQECGAIHAEKKPLSQAISRLGAAIGPRLKSQRLKLVKQEQQPQEVQQSQQDKEQGSRKIRGEHTQSSKSGSRNGKSGKRSSKKRKEGGEEKDKGGEDDNDDVLLSSLEIELEGALSAMAKVVAREAKHENEAHQVSSRERSRGRESGGEGGLLDFLCHLLRVLLRYNEILFSSLNIYLPNKR